MSRWRALSLNRGGMACVLVLGLVTLACLVGPMVLPHAYDRVFPDYVLTPASLAAHPTREERDRALETLAARMHATLELADQPDGSARLIITGPEPLDPRMLRNLERSDVIQPLFPSPLRGRIRGVGPSACFTSSDKDTKTPTPDLSPQGGEERVSTCNLTQVGSASGGIVRSSDGLHLTVPVTITHQYFLFGTDANGRDLLTRILVAGRISLAVGALASAVALGIGIAYGAIAGTLGGRADAVMMRTVDVIYALPFIFLVIVLVVLFGRTLLLIFVAIGAVEWLDMARIVRGQTLSLKRREYVLAARALGASDGAILARHIIPNMRGPIIAYLGLLVPRVILAESFLSFLGLGVQEPLTSWGILIADGARNVQSALHLLIFPALFLAVTLVAATQLGEALRRASAARADGGGP